TGPNCSVTAPTGRRASHACRCPRISGGVVFSAVIEVVGAIKSTPDNHFAAGPHGGVKLSTARRSRRIGPCVINTSGFQYFWKLVATTWQYRSSRYLDIS